jgi:hypothetical protein
MEAYFEASSHLMNLNHYIEIAVNNQPDFDKTQVRRIDNYLNDRIISSKAVRDVAET